MSDSPFAMLLALQDLDTQLDQLRHREAHHPLQAELDALSSEQASHERVIAEVEAERAVLERDRKRLEDEVTLTEDRRKDSEARLYDGTVTATKDLLALQDEIAALGERQRGLEDDELLVMEALEPIEQRLAELDVVTQAMAERQAALSASLEEALGEIRAEQAALVADRAGAAEPVSAELLAEYERLRFDLGGVAVAALVGSMCNGCHLALSAVAADRLKSEPADAVLHCPECGRILVR